ncbi:aminotransferase class I/II-fold pyridoxal phosphate-dependent enzyme [Galbibacter mesophilus]|uniref:aminotransferase class I/II-fold pyridoxal phosphate-dependent enzyme n=1 Tax=Galbibacter mesophilus TaxID=379069 RepID=UPI0019203A01|nr:aminotransferase class I/II-fold pyridoxal phosphate-dependent enzyme [Galbibacter mesophilus]MCM5663652.1 bifunctional aminotransferase class I/II-fold pyridoxal phosphate-dependent enzyme/GNAT family N-acetyltransferase [Galbibacter mesophilus]
MAKIKNNNFLDTVNDVFTDAKKQGVLHLYAEDENFSGRHIKVKGKSMYHFGTTGYLGLEQDVRLKKAAVDAILKYGTQFPLSKTYISHPLYRELEEKIGEMYGQPVIITKNSTLGHMGVIPSAVSDRDAIILDHQVHWSVQSAAKILKLRSVPIEMIRHNNLQMLEDKIKKLSPGRQRIWYMADGVYSMYGDEAPVLQLMELAKKYSQLHIYFDDVHGMSWAGRHGTGFVMDKLKELPENVLLFGTLSKTFGASGSVLVCRNREMYHKIKTFGGPLTFSAQLDPASVAAATASATIHLTDEIYGLQKELLERIELFNGLFEKTDLPLIDRNSSPVFYIGTGMPITGYNFVNRLMQEGFFVNLGIFPAVPVKNTGVRITISRHNHPKEIKALVQAMEFHYPKALEDTYTTDAKVRKAFGLLSVSSKTSDSNVPEGLKVDVFRSIKQIQKSIWNGIFNGHGVFDWEGLAFLEEVFSGNKTKHNNWSFHYLMVSDQMGRPILATFFTHALWKEDMLAPKSVSEKIERIRESQPDYMVSDVLGMGSLFTEGDHLFLDKDHPRWRDALHAMFAELDRLDQKLNPQMIVLRDFRSNDVLNEMFHNQGYVKVSMPDASILENLEWANVETYVTGLSARSRRHFRNDVAVFTDHFKVEILQRIGKDKGKIYYSLLEQVRKNNLGLNTFAFPYKMLGWMSSHPNWEFITLTLKKQFSKMDEDRIVGVMFCYKNGTKTYVPSFVGMDYGFAHSHGVYRQLLFQTVKRAGESGFTKIDFGMTAAFEKKKMGATVVPKVAYIQAKDNYAMELMGFMEELA